MYTLHLVCQSWWGRGVPWQIIAYFSGLGADRTIRDANVPYQFPECSPPVPQSGLKNWWLWRPRMMGKRVSVNCHLPTCDQWAAPLEGAFGRRWGKINQGFWIYNLVQINLKTWVNPKITKSVPKEPLSLWQETCSNSLTAIISSIYPRSLDLPWNIECTIYSLKKEVENPPLI